jgi:hypothetical protein
MFIDYDHYLFTILFISHNLFTTVHRRYPFCRAINASHDTNLDMRDNKPTLCYLSTSYTTASLILHIASSILFAIYIL